MKKVTNVNSENLLNEPASYTFVSTDTLRNIFPEPTIRGDGNTDSALTREGFFQFLGKVSRKISEPDSKESET